MQEDDLLSALKLTSFIANLNSLIIDVGRVPQSGDDIY
jgi:hypothetical protein